ncbi:hypothetical protein GCM10027294_16920 [Marinactinospora endophytica]
MSLALLALLATGCGSGDEGATLASTEGGPTPEETYAGAVPAAQAPAPEGYDPVEIEGIRINAPRGWQVDQGDGQLCMRPPEQDSCGYGAVQVIPHVSQRDPASWPKKNDAFNKKDGWAADPSACRSLATAEAGDVGIKDAEHRADFTTHADGLKSNFSTWEVTCDNGDTFGVKLWFLPVSDVAVYAWSVDARYEDVYLEIAKSMDITEYKK